MEEPQKRQIRLFVSGIEFLEPIYPRVETFHDPATGFVSGMPNFFLGLFFSRLDAGDVSVMFGHFGFPLVPGVEAKVFFLPVGRLDALVLQQRIQLRAIIDVCRGYDQ